MSLSVRSLIVDLAARFGGTSARVLGLLQAMPPGEAALASLAGSPVTQEAKSCGLEVHTVGSHKLDPRIGRRIAAIVQKNAFAVVDAQNPQSKLWASRAAACVPCALVSTLNSWYLSEHGGNLKGRFYHSLERITSGHLDLYIAVSREIHAQLLESGVPAERIALIENAILLDPKQIDGSPAWLRRTFGLPDDAYIMCAVGRLVEVKGFEYLIRSVGELLQRHTHLYCLIIGDGEIRGRLASLISELGLQERVRLAGLRPRGEVLRIVKAADLFVMPSLSEGTPVALLEAAALTKPIVASEVGGIPNILTHHVDALLTKPQSVSSLADAISQMIDDRQRAAAFGRRALERVAEDFSIETQVAATREAYRAACRHFAQRTGRPQPAGMAECGERLGLPPEPSRSA